MAHVNKAALRVGQVAALRARVAVELRAARARVRAWGRGEGARAGLACQQRYAQVLPRSHALFIAGKSARAVGRRGPWLHHPRGTHEELPADVVVGAAAPVAAGALDDDVAAGVQVRAGLSEVVVAAVQKVAADLGLAARPASGAVVRRRRRAAADAADADAANSEAAAEASDADAEAAAAATTVAKAAASAAAATTAAAAAAAAEAESAASQRSRGPWVEAPAHGPGKQQPTCAAAASTSAPAAAAAAAAAEQVEEVERAGRRRREAAEAAARAGARAARCAKGRQRAAVKKHAAAAGARARAGARGGCGIERGRGGR